LKWGREVLHYRSHFSFRGAYGSPDAIAARCWELGFTAAVLADRDSTFGWPAHAGIGVEGEMGPVHRPDRGPDHHIGPYAMGQQRTQHSHMNGAETSAARDDESGLARAGHA
jgi:hypothetical protein